MIFRDDFERSNEGLQNEMEIEMGRNEEIVDTYGEDTKEWQEEYVWYDQ